MITRKAVEKCWYLLKEARSVENICLVKKFIHDQAEWNKARSYDSIPTVKPIPILGNKWRGIPIVGTIDSSALHKSMEHMYREYGDVVKFPELVDDHDVVFLFDVNDVEKVLKSETNRPFLKSIHHYKYELRKDVFGKYPGILDVNTEDWEKCFSKIYNVVLSDNIADNYICQIEEITNLFVNRIKLLKNSEDEVPENFIKEINKFSIELLIGIVLDSQWSSLNLKQNTSEIQNIMNALEDIGKITGSSDIFTPIRTKFNTPGWKKYVEGLDFILEIIQKYSVDYYKNLKNEKGMQNIPLCQKILQANENNPCVAEVAAFDFSLIIKDTISTTLASVIYQLSQHQDVQDILYREIVSLLKTDEVKLTPDILKKMRYLTACIKETLRMYPIVVGNTRYASEDIILSGYQIPKGTQMIFGHFVISNSVKHFNNYSKFQPERWLSNKSHEVHRYAVIPYGNGKRMCPMKNVAEMQIKIAICKLVQQFKIEFRHKEIEYSTTPLLGLNGPLQFAFSARE